jgi:hypothetical protein
MGALPERPVFRPRLPPFALRTFDVLVAVLIFSAFS